MEIQGTTVLVTGANRGLGRQLVAALLERGAAKVYAAARVPSAPSEPRVAPIALELTSPDTIRAAASTASDATIVINNAGTAAFAGPLDADPAALRGEMAVNYDGTFEVVRTFVPVLERNGGGHVVNVLSLLSLASTPPMTGYSASKAAAHSLTQALRQVLRA
jgi:NAD(P)-dependent dehydrogenase (short-subunit alcohol dehydrogenase family)